MYHDMPAMFHALHAKDHFATNVAVAGGLLLLLQEDPGHGEVHLGRNLGRVDEEK